MSNFFDGEAFGRVNLMGEHLDYNQGCVIPLQINRSVKVRLKKDISIGGIKIKSENYDDEVLINVLNKKMASETKFGGYPLDLLFGIIYLKTKHPTSLALPFDIKKLLIN